MRSPRRPLIAVVGLLAAVLATSSCGVPVDSEASVTPSEEVPFDLLSVTTTTQFAGTPAEGATNICLAFEGGLFSLGRDRSGDLALADLESLVTAGPTEGEAELGLRSALQSEESITGVATIDSIAEVDLAEEFGDLTADQQLLAVAQVTCTLTAQPSIDAVRFTLGDRDVEVPVETGELVARTVMREDYARLINN